MKKEDRELLIKELCGRLPYGVKIALKNNGGYHHENIAKKGDVTIDELKGFSGTYFSIFHKNPNEWDWYDDDIDVEDIKPYLFPISSMTEEQKKEISKRYNLHTCYGFIEITDHTCGCYEDDNSCHLQDYLWLVDWFNKNHFDYRGLIQKGIAIDATGLNIY